MNPSELARYTSDRARRRFELKRNRSDAAAEVQEPSVTTYQGYDADTGLHLTSDGDADLMLGNVGLDAGQLINFSGRHIDTSPRIRVRKRSDEVFGGEDPIWAVCWTQYYFLGDDISTGSNWEHRVYLCTNRLLEPTLIYTEPGYVSTAPEIAAVSLNKILPIFPVLSIDESQTIYLDIKIGQKYPYQDPLTNQWSIEVLPDLVLKHWEIRGTVIEEVTEVSDSNWRKPWVTSTRGFNGDPDDYDSCLVRFWSDRMEYVLGEPGVSTLFTTRTDSWNISKLQQTLYSGVGSSLGGAPRGGLANGQLNFFVYKAALDSCSLNPSDPNPEGTQFTVNFPPVDLTGTTSTIPGSGAGLQFSVHGCSAVILL